MSHSAPDATVVDMSTTNTHTPTTINGIPVDAAKAALANFGANPDLAAFRFSAKNTWIDGTASASTIHEWYGGGGEHLHVEEFRYAADHPTLGSGHGPTPQEFLLHALAACITTGIVIGAAVRDIEVRTISSTVSAPIDVRGLLGIDPDVRKGFEEIAVTFDIDADADDDTIDALLAAGVKYSAIFDTVVNPTEVTVQRAEG